MTRAERVAEAQRLRYAEKLLLREISERMGMAVGTVHQYLSDPDLSKLRARCRSYATPCVDCGMKTGGQRGRGKGAKRCGSCHAEHIHATREWNEGDIIEALRSYAFQYGTPSARDFNRTQARATGHPELAERHEAGHYPGLTTVQKRFGSWSNALRAAGLTPRPTGRPPKN